MPAYPGKLKGTHPDPQVTNRGFKMDVTFQGHFKLQGCLKWQAILTIGYIEWKQSSLSCMALYIICKTSIFNMS